MKCCHNTERYANSIDRTSESRTPRALRFGYKTVINTRKCKQNNITRQTTAVKPIKLETNVKSPIKQELRDTEGRIDEQITKVFFEYEGS